MVLERVGSVLGVGVIFDALLLGGDLMLTLGTELFTPLAISASWLAPEVSWMNEELVTLLAVFAAALYVTNMLITRYERFKNGGLTDDE